MNKLNSLTGVIIATALLAHGATGLSYADDTQIDNISSFLCKDILRVAGDERDIAVAFMHGYLLGTSGKQTFNRSTLSAATDGFIEACLNDVDAVAVKTLQDQIR